MNANVDRKQPAPGTADVSISFESRAVIPVRVFKLEGGGYLTIPARTPHRLTSILEPQGAIVEEIIAVKVRHTSELAEAAHNVAREVEELTARKDRLVKEAEESAYIQGRRSVRLERKAERKGRKR